MKTIRPFRESVGNPDDIEFIRAMYALRGSSNVRKHTVLRRRLRRAAEFIPAITAFVMVLTLIAVIVWVASL